MEAFSSQRDGTLTVIKEKSPTGFEVEQTVQMMQSAKMLTLDEKTGHILLIGAEFTPPPPPASGEPPGRGTMVDSFTILVVGKERSLRAVRLRGGLLLAELLRALGDEGIT